MSGCKQAGVPSSTMPPLLLPAVLSSLPLFLCNLFQRTRESREGDRVDIHCESSSNTCYTSTKHIYTHAHILSLPPSLHSLSLTVNTASLLPLLLQGPPPLLSGDLGASLAETKNQPMQSTDASGQLQRCECPCLVRLTLVQASHGSNPNLKHRGMPWKPLVATWGQARAAGLRGKRVAHLNEGASSTWAECHVGRLDRG